MHMRMLTAALALLAILYATINVSLMAQTQQTVTLEFLERDPIIVELPMSGQSFLALLESEGVTYRLRHPANYPPTNPPWIREHATTAYSFLGGRNKKIVLRHIAYVIDGFVVHIETETGYVKH